MGQRTVAVLIAVVVVGLGLWWVLARSDGPPSGPIAELDRGEGEPAPDADPVAPGTEADDAVVPEPEPPPPPPEPAPARVTHPPDGIVVPALSLEDAAGENALAYLAEACGLELQISAAARPMVEEINVSLEVENLKASTILDLVTEPYGLVWQVKGDKLIIEDGEG